MLVTINNKIAQQVSCVESEFIINTTTTRLQLLPSDQVGKEFGLKYTGFME